MTMGRLTLSTVTDTMKSVFRECFYDRYCLVQKRIFSPMAFSAPPSKEYDMCFQLLLTTYDHKLVPPINY